jgi:anti-anti-sigma factor
MDNDLPVNQTPEPGAYPADPEACLGLAKECYERADYQQAVGAAQRALQLGVQTPEVRLVLGRAWMALGYPAEAAFQFKLILERDPNHAEANAFYDPIRRSVAAIDFIRSANPRELQLDVQRHVVVVRPVGMMAPYTEEENLREAFDRLTGAISLLIQMGATGCVVDLTGVTFITSFFLGMLLEWRRKTTAEGRPMALCVTRREIREVLTTTRISRLIPLMESLDEAIQYIHLASI